MLVANKMLRPCQGGYTLVEILMAIIVGGLLVGSANIIMVNQFNISQRGRDIVIANSFAEGKMEALRSAGFSGLTNGATDITTDLPSELAPPRNALLTIASQTVAIKKVTLDITYNDQGDRRVYKYTTFIGELGVGQY